MGLTVSFLYEGWTMHTVFGDGGQWCPVCGSHEFVSIEPAGGLWCAGCRARFSCRSTAGDPGLVVDCHPSGYDHKGVFLNGGVKFWLDPRHFREQIVAFWQVLKECEGGLGDRNRWCSSALSGAGGLHLTRPLGVELFQFDPYRVAEGVLFQQWHAEHAADKPDFTDWKAYLRWQSDCIQWVQARRPQLERDLAEGRAPGYYTCEQCERVLEGDYYFIRRCLPKVGERPVVAAK